MLAQISARSSKTSCVGCRSRLTTVRALPGDATWRSSSSSQCPAMLTAAALTAAALLGGSPVHAEEVAAPPPETAAVEGLFKGFNDPQKQKLKAADEAFQNSGTLKALMEKSEANKAKNKRDIQNKYCYRQAELGIGDCGGLRLIPGMTQSGKQATPEWLQKALGVEVPPVEGQGKTLKDLLGPDVQP